MSEGTMQRAAQREVGVPPTPFRQWGSAQSAPRAKRLNRVLVGAAAVPMVFLAAACSSSDSGSGSGDGAQQTATAGAQGSTSPSASPTVQAAAYAELPEACRVLSDKTLGDLVPKGAKSAKQGSSSDLSTRAGCSWSSLDNNGVKGSQFRWLNVSLLRFESDASRGTGEKQAQEFYQRQVDDARSVPDAKNTKAEPLSGTGDEATVVRYDLKKKEGAFKQQTVVARVENVVVTLDYNGAGLAGDSTPDADGLVKSAEKAAKEAVTAVAKANGAAGDGSAPSASSSPSATKSPGKPASPSASASASEPAAKG
ncbi:DUF3558 domain-containing protein [Streptomyces sp. NTH33]|uniref:DUF3558 family protein n=1 Tax=Streptomyces sp. NTH33 TaxID=1735453 RepID=UPI000DA95E0C|nr:DUF3558 family protein [Streptomyces sp. NTH33]PZH03139.1 DUF3558 domain-containing protein [Streptomyces sp. NTH33]